MVVPIPPLTTPTVNIIKFLYENEKKNERVNSPSNRAVPILNIIRFLKENKKRGVSTSSLTKSILYIYFLK